MAKQKKRKDWLEIFDELRDVHGMKDQEIADEMGCHFTYIYRLRTESRGGRITYDFVTRLKELLKKRRAVQLMKSQSGKGGRG